MVVQSQGVSQNIILKASQYLDVKSGKLVAPAVLVVRDGTISSIQKNISMHIARHSFGNISGNKIPIQMLQKLYRHSSVTTTIRYQANFIHKDADDVLDSVVNF